MNNVEVLFCEWLVSNVVCLGLVFIEYLWVICICLLDCELMLCYCFSELCWCILFYVLFDVGYLQVEVESLVEVGFQVFFEVCYWVILFFEVYLILEIFVDCFIFGVFINGNVDVCCLGLVDYFWFVFCVEELGVGKFDLMLFCEVLKCVGVEVLVVIYIGDYFSDDIVGVCCVGMCVIWFNLSGKFWVGEEELSVEICSFVELLVLFVCL